MGYNIILELNSTYRSIYITLEIASSLGEYIFYKYITRNKVPEMFQVNFPDNFDRLVWQAIVCQVSSSG